MSKAILYRPIVAASLRADANRRFRSVGRHQLATFHQATVADANGTTAVSGISGNCEPAVKIKSILEQYRRDK